MITVYCDWKGFHVFLKYVWSLNAENWEFEFCCKKFSQFVQFTTRGRCCYALKAFTSKVHLTIKLTWTECLIHHSVFYKNALDAISCCVFMLLIRNMFWTEFSNTSTIGQLQDWHQIALICSGGNLCACFPFSEFETWRTKQIFRSDRSKTWKKR